MIINERRVTGKSRKLVAILIVLVIVTSIFSIYLVFLNKKVDEWNDKAYSGVNINELDLSGKTKEEIIKLLNEGVVSKLQDKKIDVNVEDKHLVYNYSELLSNYNVEKAAEEAITFGKDLGVFKKNSLIKNKDNEKHNINLEFTYDEERLVDLQNDIRSKLNINPVNAKININKGNINIIPEKIGYKLNDAKLDEALRNSINGDLREDTIIKLCFEEDSAKITENDLLKIKKEPMGTYSTSFTTSDANRSFNIDLVTSLIDGIVLMPGEEFSYSTISQKGRGKYKDATAYVNDKPVPSEGGGICQGSTTLYRAVMKANIRSTERYNHSLPVGYAALGLDATVAWGYLDYKFKNPYDFPIYIEGITENKILTFNIYGDPTVLGNKTYDMVSEIKGKEAKSYQVTYENGKEVNREFIAKDIYK